MSRAEFPLARKVSGCTLPNYFNEYLYTPVGQGQYYEPKTY